MSGIMDWIQQRVVLPVQEQLKSGLSPEKLAWSFAFGISCGLFPIPGTTAVLCAIATYCFALNPVIPQGMCHRYHLFATSVLNLILTPIEVGCIPLFYHLGDWVLGNAGQDVSVSDLVSGLKTDFFKTVEEFQGILLKACLGWTIWVIPATYLLHIVTLPILRRTMQEQGRVA